MIFQYILLITSYVYNLMIFIIYFSKSRIPNIETKIYNVLLISNLFGIALEALCVILGQFQVPDYISIWLVRLYMVYIAIWMFTFTGYIIFIARSTSNKKKLIKSEVLKRIFRIAFFIVVALIFILPMGLYSNNGMSYSYGPSSDFLSFVHMIGVTIGIVVILINRKTIELKKKIPMFILIICTALIVIVKTINPAIQIIGMTFVFITVLMYHTIENPDTKVIDSFKEMKEYVDTANNEKEMFIYDISQTVKEDMSKIEHVCDEMKDIDNVKELKEGTEYIKDIVKNIYIKANSIYDISNDDMVKLNITNKSYNFDHLIKEVKMIAKNNLKNDNVKLIFNISDNMPNILYGDVIRFKQILTIILNNSIKYTKKGYIELNVKYICKNDICRLIITVTDSGVGINQKDLKNILENGDTDKEGLYLAKTLIRMLGGTLVVNSEEGVGTKVSIFVDQKYEKDNNNVFKKIDDIDKNIIKNSRVLVVDNNDIVIKKISKILNKYSIDCEGVTESKECLDKIRNGEDYDLIFISKNLNKIDGFETIKKLNQIDDFDTPIILMIEENDSVVHSNEISDILEKPIDVSALLEFIKKYLKK